MGRLLAKDISSIKEGTLTPFGKRKRIEAMVFIIFGFIFGVVLGNLLVNILK